MAAGERAGDCPRFDAAALQAQLERAVVRLCPRWLASERDDLVQASLLRVLETLSRRSPDDTRELNTTYLWSAAYSAVLDELRRIRRRPRLVHDEEAAARPAAGGPHDRLEARELARHVRDCLAGIDDARRHAVQLRLAGFGHEEIAALLGGPLRRASNLVFRGMDDLRSCLRGKGVPA
ncbi:MAG: sigma-70 family RNA polymerase sigma factor [Acidobacteria bacterium]|nr:sigma-70 family RNA polymerase sigma factor [Acidobacteriota bacterium]